MMKQKDKEQIPELKRDGWNACELSEESANKPSDEIVLELLQEDSADDSFRPADTSVSPLRDLVEEAESTGKEEKDG